MDIQISCSIPDTHSLICVLLLCTNLYCIGGGFRRTDNVRPAGSIKQSSKSKFSWRTREEILDITGEIGSGQDWIEEGEHIIDRNMEECNGSK